MILTISVLDLLLSPPLKERDLKNSPTPDAF
jgi:hypothetical protein